MILKVLMKKKEEEEGLRSVAKVLESSLKEWKWRILDSKESN